MTTQKWVITGAAVAVLTAGAIVMRRSETKATATAAAVCPTARPLPTYAPTPASAYCTEKRFYVRACEVKPPPAKPTDQIYTAMWATGAPGTTAQICSAHTWAVNSGDGFMYPIVDQGPVSTKYPRPPSPGPALDAWNACWLDHNPPAGGYEGCLASPSGGTLVYQPLVLAAINPAQIPSFSTKYGCCGVTPSPTPTMAIPPTMPPPLTRTATPAFICIPVTVTAKPAPTDLPERKQVEVMKKEIIDREFPHGQIVASESVDEFIDRKTGDA